MSQLCLRCVGVLRHQIYSLGLRHLSTTKLRCSIDSQTQSENNSEEKEERVKETILTTALKYVDKHGWTQEALSLGAEECGYPGIAHGMFPDGGVELVHFVYRTNNEKLADILRSEVAEAEQNPDLKKSTQRFTTDALKTRLEMTIPYLDIWPQAMGLMALPQNVPTALQNLTQLTDDIWYHAGDRSTDFTWYTKRASLAFVYKTSELSLIQDKSEGFKDTWEFMNRRVEDVVTAGKRYQQVGQSTEVLSEVVKNASIIVKNLIGVNDRNR